MSNSATAAVAADREAIHVAPPAVPAHDECADNLTIGLGNDERIRISSEEPLGIA